MWLLSMFPVATEERFTKTMGIFHVFLSLLMRKRKRCWKFMKTYTVKQGAIIFTSFWRLHEVTISYRQVGFQNPIPRLSTFWQPPSLRWNKQLIGTGSHHCNPKKMTLIEGSPFDKLYPLVTCTKSYRTWPTEFAAFPHYKWWFSIYIYIVALVYHRG